MALDLMDLDLNYLSELDRDTHPVRASIIIVNYNGGDYVVSCLESVMETVDASTEVIVVDNGSADGSEELIERSFPTITLLRSESNCGFGGGNNLGAMRAEGDYLVFVNPDTKVTPGWWEALVNALENDPTAGVATAQILLSHDPHYLNAAGNDIHLTGLTLCRGMGRPADTYSQGGIVSAVSGAAFAIRRELFQEMGQFDADYFLYMEETDLSWRVQIAGYHCLYVPEAVVLHDYQLRFGPDKTYYQERNRYRMLLKTLRWPTLMMLLPVLLLAEVVTWGYVLVGDRQHWSGKLRAYAATLRDWPDIRKQRQGIQACRSVGDRQLLELATGRLDFAQTGTGSAVILANSLFNPLFSLWHRFLLMAVKW